MNKRIVLRRLLALALLLALTAAVPYAGAALLYAAQKNAYEDTYYAELPRKLDRLENTQGARLVVVGGSSAAFGIDSKLAEQELGMPCVNFGLYAAFGLKPMLDLSLPRLHEGDIVVVMPETTQQMYSAYCGYDHLLQAFETRPGVLFRLGTDYYPGLVSKVPGYVRSAGQLREKGGAPNAGVYSLSSFDEWGDIVYPRSENVMARGYIEDNLPQLDPAIVTKQFLDMVNGYARSAKGRGAQVYFSFCPINELSLAGSDAAQRESFVKALQDGLDCEILSPLSDHVMDAGFFYDSNYHLNDAGMKYNTLMLVSDVQRTQGSMRMTSASLPHAPALDRDDAVLSSGVEGGIAYDVTVRGAVVTGLDDDAKMRVILDIPEKLGGADVVSVSSEAFSGSLIQMIILPSSVASLPGRVFAGADSLDEVRLMAKSLPEVGDALLQGAAPGLRLRVPQELYGAYITDYFWGLYVGQLEALP